jgi:hypothetical protein
LSHGIPTNANSSNILSMLTILKMNVTKTEKQSGQSSEEVANQEW